MTYNVFGGTLNLYAQSNPIQQYDQHTTNSCSYINASYKLQLQRLDASKTNQRQANQQQQQQL